MGCLKLSIRRSKQIMQVVKMDGKVVQFKAPILAKELLVYFEGYGVTSSRKSTRELPPYYELQLGKIYYLFPCRKLCPVTAADDGVSSATDDGVPTAVVKRIKVVITKKQLGELLSKKTSVEKIMLGIDNTNCSWKPSLLSIPEENENEFIIM